MLKRMESIWNRVSTLDNAHPEVLEKATKRVILRQNNNDPEIVQCAMFEPQNVNQKFAQLRMMLKGSCRSLSYYFEVNQPVSHVLKELGFKSTEKDVWTLDNRDYMVTTTVNPSYSESPMVIDIKAKRSNGIPPTAGNIVTLFESKMQQARLGVVV